MKKMKLPNKYGSVYKLSGKRRKPWAVRKTVGWKQVPEKMKSYPIYEFIGFYATRSEALQALAAYNEDPYESTQSLLKKSMKNGLTFILKRCLHPMSMDTKHHSDCVIKSRT